MTADELRQRRVALGMSQTALAQRLSVRLDTYNRWERGRQEMPWHGMLDLALRALEAERSVPHDAA